MYNCNEPLMDFQSEIKFDYWNKSNFIVKPERIFRVSYRGFLFDEASEKADGEF